MIANNQETLACRHKYEVSIILPCLNEVGGVRDSILNAMDFLDKHHLRGEIIVVDNGSTDGSIDIVKSMDVILLNENKRGYGRACLKGFSAAQGAIVIIADSDGTYDFGDSQAFLEQLAKGFDLVIGSRLRGRISPKSMPWLHRYIGVPFLTWILNITAKCDISDAHCGLRAIKRDVLCEIDLRAGGFEIASEMIFKASKQGFKIIEIPVSYYHRKGYSKLKTFRDGLRHLWAIIYYAVLR